MVQHSDGIDPTLDQLYLLKQTLDNMYKLIKVVDQLDTPEELGQLLDMFKVVQEYTMTKKEMVDYKIDTRLSLVIGNNQEILVSIKD